MRPSPQAATSPLLNLAPRVLAALLLAGVLVGWGSGPARAQSIWVTPLFGLSEDYDTNVTLTPKATSDFVTTVKPGLALQLKDYPFDLSLSADVRMQFYATHSDLDTETDNVDASGTLTYAPTPTLKLSLTDTWIRNVNPALVAPQTGISTGRFVSTGNTVSPSLTYQFDPLTTGTFQYTLTSYRSSAQGAVNSDTHRGDVGALREFTPLVSGGLRYIYSRFQEANTPDLDSHSPRLSLAFRFTPTIKVSSDTGPIWIERLDRSYGVTFASDTRYEQQFEQGSIGLAYSRDAGVGGLTGVISTTQSVLASGRYLATRALTLGLEAGWSETKSAGGSSLDTQNFTAGFRATYRVLRWLSLEASYRYLKQNDLAGPNSLDQQVISIGLTASDQFRVY